MTTGYDAFRAVTVHARRRALATVVHTNDFPLRPCPHCARLAALWLWLVHWQRIQTGGVCCGFPEPSPLPSVSVANAPTTATAPLPGSVWQWPAAAAALAPPVMAGGVVLAACALMADTAGRRALWLLGAHAAARRICHQRISCKHDALAHRWGRLPFLPLRGKRKTLPPRGEGPSLGTGRKVGSKA